MPGRGRPRLSAGEYQVRLRSYCQRYAVAPTPAGIPPFPSGRRETDQHREWLGLYKAHARLRPADAHAPATAAAPGGACGVCGRAVEPTDAVAAHRAAVLHASCQALVALVEPLGPAGLDRLRGYLWPARSKRAQRQRVK
jgi:hypothetical protein